MNIIDRPLRLIIYKYKNLLVLTIMLIPLSLVEIGFVVPVIGTIFRIGINNVNGFIVMFARLIINLLNKSLAFYMDNNVVSLIEVLFVLFAIFFFTYLLMLIYKASLQESGLDTFIDILKTNFVIYAFIFVLIVFFVIILFVLIPISGINQTLMENLREYGYEILLLPSFYFYFIVNVSTFFSIVYTLALIIMLFWYYILKYFFGVKKFTKLFKIFGKDHYLRNVTFVSIWLTAFIIYKLIFYSLLMFFYKYQQSSLIFILEVLINTFIVLVFLYFLGNFFLAQEADSHKRKSNLSDEDLNHI